MTAERRPDLEQLLADATDGDRQVIAAWLAGRDTGEYGSGIAGLLAVYAERRVSDEHRQLVKFRLSTTTYARFQRWCADNGTTMSAALRGLVEALLDQAKR